MASASPASSSSSPSAAAYSASLRAASASCAEGAKYLGRVLTRKNVSSWPARARVRFHLLKLALECGNVCEEIPTDRDALACRVAADSPL